MKTIFILNEDAGQLRQLNNHFISMGYTVRSFSSTAEFESVNDKPFLIILDEKMDDDSNTSMQFLKHIGRKMSGVPVIYMAAEPDRKLIAEALKSGAYEIIQKNSAALVNLRTTIDRLISQPVGGNWFTRLFKRKDPNNLPALSM